jgi:hypothetical protein
MKMPLKARIKGYEVFQASNGIWKANFLDERVVKVFGKGASIIFQASSETTAETLASILVKDARRQCRAIRDNFLGKLDHKKI